MFAAATALCLAPVATGAPQSGPPNALQGFSQNRGKPINIESVSLEVRDKDKIATFIDNVKLVQGDTTLECKKLIVYYDQQATPVSNAAPSRSSDAGQGGQQIRRLEAKGGVVVTQKDQTATGDDGHFDMQSNSVTLTGNVTITQGPNVIRGDRLWVDLNSGVSRVESSAKQGPVRALINPNSTPKPPSGAAKPDSKNAAGSGARTNVTGSTGNAGEGRNPRPRTAGADAERARQTQQRSSAPPN